MTDLQACQAAVIRDPSSDLFRLLFADAVEESDPARAEFTRIQLELVDLEARLIVAENSERPISDSLPLFERIFSLRRRESELLETNGRKWLTTFIGQIIGYSYATGTTLEAVEAYRRGLFAGELLKDGNLVFRRGFVDAVTASCADWLSHGPAIVASQPVTSLTLDRKPSQSYGKWTWYYSQHGQLDRRDLLPFAIWNRPAVPDFIDFHENKVYGVKGYDTEREATEAVHADFLAWARAEAKRKGLMP